MSVNRDWMPLGEVFSRIADAPATKAKAKMELIKFPGDWSLYDVVNLVTEEEMSEAGRIGILKFMGLRSKYAKNSSPVPTTWFESKDSNEITIPRGVDPDAAMLLFSPLHNQLHEDFDSAVSFQVQDRADPPRWFEVVVQSGTLNAFLIALGSFLPEAGPILSNPSNKIINDTIAKLRAADESFGPNDVIKELENQGYDPSRESIREAIKKAGLTRKRGRPPSQR